MIIVMIHNLVKYVHISSYSSGLPIPVVGISVGIRHQDYGTNDL